MPLCGRHQSEARERREADQDVKICMYIILVYKSRYLSVVCLFPHVKRVGIRVAENRHGSQTHRTCTPDDPASDLSPIRDQ